MQLQVKTILNLIQPFTGFVYEDIRLADPAAGRGRELHITLVAHAGIPPKCSCCRQPAPGDDHLPMRPWLFVPLWGLVTWFFYAPRRVTCPTHGVVVEYLPWSVGQRPVTLAMMGFLARWARRLSWRETAQVFRTSWENVYQSVDWFVEWGLAHRDLTGITALGVDDLHWGQGQGANRFLTVIDQIDGHGRRLLWVGRKRTEATLREGLAVLGAPVVGGVRYVSSDLWRPCLKVIAARISQALHVLDRFHITMHLNQAVDATRRPRPPRSRRCAGSCCAGAVGCAAGRGGSSTRWCAASWPPPARGSSRIPSNTSGMINPSRGRGCSSRCGPNGPCAAGLSRWAKSPGCCGPMNP